MTIEEWHTRVDLAACYRLMAHFGMDDLIYNHISARVPGPDEHFLLNPFGLLYEEITASNLVKVDLDGRYYLTGDTGSMDENGYFYFSTRDDDVIIMAGYRIGPFEVESALSTHEAVAECAVIATPDKVRGEVIEAFVVLMPGASKGDQLTDELQKWVKTNFAAHAYPRHITYVEELPKTPSGKIQRFVLREQRNSEISGELSNG